MSDLFGVAAELSAGGFAAGRQAARIVEERATDVENVAKQLAPVDTGNLRRSITHDVHSGGLAADIGSDVEYAEHVERGTASSPPQPYMEPALDEFEQPFIDDIARIPGGLF